jgi:hypothetical protein
MGKARLRPVTPDTVNGPVASRNPPQRRRNRDVRSREYLTQGEVERLIAAAGRNHYAHLIDRITTADAISKK